MLFQKLAVTCHLMPPAGYGKELNPYFGLFRAIFAKDTFSFEYPLYEKSTGKKRSNLGLSCAKFSPTSAQS